MKDKNYEDEQTKAYYQGNICRLPINGIDRNSILHEGEITEEMNYLEKNLASLQSAVENLQLKTIKITRPEPENCEGGEVVKGRNSEISITLQQRNSTLRNLTDLINSVTERIEL